MTCIYWNWVLPPEAKGMRVIVRCLAKNGCPVDKLTTPNLLDAIKSLAIANLYGKTGLDFHVEEGITIDICDGAASSVPVEPNVKQDKEVQPFSVQSCKVGPTVMPDMGAASSVPVQSHVQQEKEVQQQSVKSCKASPIVVPSMGTDRNMEATKWKDVLMPFPLKMQAPFANFKGDFPLPKVLVLDMNGVLMRRYAYPECAPECPKGCYRFKVYKRTGNMGTVCIIRGDAYDFVEACSQIFSLCLWSSCTKPNMDAAMKGIFRGLHPKVWKDVLTQTECTRLPFKQNEVRNLEESEKKTSFCEGYSRVAATKSIMAGGEDSYCRR